MTHPSRVWHTWMPFLPTGHSLSPAPCWLLHISPFLEVLFKLGSRESSYSSSRCRSNGTSSRKPLLVVPGSIQVWVLWALRGWSVSEQCKSCKTYKGELLFSQYMMRKLRLRFYNLHKVTQLLSGRTRTLSPALDGLHFYPQGCVTSQYHHHFCFHSLTWSSPH